jgi:transcriptional regulator with XRE-family HTH domain
MSKPKEQKTPISPLKRTRLAHGLTLVQVAKAIKADDGNLSKLENGKMKSEELAKRLVLFFNGAITFEQIQNPWDEPPSYKPRKTAADLKPRLALA